MKRKKQKRKYTPTKRSKSSLNAPNAETTLKESLKSSATEEQQQSQPQEPNSLKNLTERVNQLEAALQAVGEQLADLNKAIALLSEMAAKQIETNPAPAPASEPQPNPLGGQILQMLLSRLFETKKPSLLEQAFNEWLRKKLAEDPLENAIKLLRAVKGLEAGGKLEKTKTQA